MTDDPGNTSLTALRRQIPSQIASLADRSLEQLRRLRRQMSRDLQALPGPVVLDLAALLIEDGCARWFAYELVHHHSAAMSVISVRTLSRLGRDLASWGDVDAFGCYLLGPAWHEDRFSNTHVQAWAKSPDRWRRRAALVATVALNTPARGGNGDIPRTLMICDLLVDDRDDMVVKALSWALRSLAAREPAAVHAYVAKRESQLAARVLREVRNKLRTGLKNPGGRVAKEVRVATRKIPKKKQNRH